ncbi:MAG: methyltransferase [Campylobacterota bacterium]|nr:methyltransferase [Campylobacterota bacterium]
MQKELKKETDIVKEFSRFANQYNSYNVIQRKVAKTLVNQLSSNNYSTIVDIGSGSGALFKNIEENKISYKKFIALDSSQNMLDIHPSGTKVIKICADFNVPKTFDLFSLDKDGLLLSSSALQWSKTLNSTLFELSKKSINAEFAIFTSSTFKTLHHIAQIDSPIHSADTIKKVISQYYNCTYKIENYTLSFDSVREMFHYIKRSGVSGGNKQLSYRQMKYIMNAYPLNYLEFEVLFVKAKSVYIDTV